MTIKEIGVFLRDRRKMLGVTQPDLAEMAQISINTLYKIERGEANPSVKVLKQIAETLGLEIALAIKKTGES
jgi:transcriptional regulator with XRE-family HTH domain